MWCLDSAWQVWHSHNFYLLQHAAKLLQNQSLSWCHVSHTHTHHILVSECCPLFQWPLKACVICFCHLKYVEYKCDEGCHSGAIFYVVNGSTLHSVRCLVVRLFFWLHFICHSAVVKQRMKTVCSVHLHCLKLNGHWVEMETLRS